MFSIPQYLCYLDFWTGRTRSPKGGRGGLERIWGSVAGGGGWPGGWRGETQTGVFRGHTKADPLEDF